MEIGGRVKLLENVHNIWISARKPVVCPQTRYCTRRNIVPKFLKNATKTLFAFCVVNNDRIYLSIPRKTKTCMLFRSNAHKNSRNFSCVHHYFFCSHQGWTLYPARSHFLCTTSVPACPNSESVSNLQRGDLLRECSFGLFGVQFDEQEQEQLSFSRNYQCEWSKKRLHFSPIVVIISSHRLKSPPPSS